MHGTGTSVEYQNLTSEGYPAPGLSRGVVRYGREYMNTRTARNTWYDIFQLIRPLAVDWLRNTWGNVNEFDRPVYDVLQRDRQVSHTIGWATSRRMSQPKVEWRQEILYCLPLVYFIYLLNCASLPNIIQ